jgi:hypothetical protein
VSNPAEKSASVAYLREFQCDFDVVGDVFEDFFSPALCPEPRSQDASQAFGVLSYQVHPLGGGIEAYAMA